MTKIIIYCLLAFGGMAGIYAGVDSITTAYTERAEYARDIESLKLAVESANAERDKAREDSAALVAQMKTDVETRERIARESIARKQKINEDLNHANQKLQRLVAESKKHLEQGAADLDACMRTVVPGGLLPRPETGPTTEVEGYLDEAASGAPGADPGAGDSQTIGDVVILAPYLQAAFRQCESDKRAIRDWIAAQPAETTQ
jgi:uncharacterized FlaG/YvyC family protein